ncbi:MAG: CPBP family intramembrane glutamic endopeptidase [Flavobacteriales bacterium]
MNTKKLLLALNLFIVGLIGVASILTMELPIPEDVRSVLEAQFSPTAIKFITLINPTIILIIALVAGILLYEKAGLEVPLLERMLGIRISSTPPLDIAKFGAIGGFVAGLLITIIAMVFEPMLPQEFLELGDNVKPSIAARFLYGGVTEELLMRFGLMTFLIWIGKLVFEGDKTSVYWLGISVSAVIFALGHFPLAFQAVGNPSALLLSYIILGNTIGGLIFGWLYWKKGLEAAILAHMLAHVVMVLAELI